MSRTSMLFLLEKWNATLSHVSDFNAVTGREYSFQNGSIEMESFVLFY
jgi:hypothetical protein